MFVAGTAQDQRASLTHRPGQGGRGPAVSMLQHRLRTHAGPGGRQRPGRVHRLRRLRVGVPAGRASCSRRRQGPLRGRRERVPRLRHLRRRLPERRHTARRLQRRRAAGGGDGVSGRRGSSRRSLRLMPSRRPTPSAPWSPSAARSAPTRPRTPAANTRTPLPPSVRLVLVPCSGRVSPLHLLERTGRGRRRRDGRRLPGGPVPLSRGQLQRHRPRGLGAAPAGAASALRRNGCGCSP